MNFKLQVYGTTPYLILRKLVAFLLEDVTCFAIKSHWRRRNGL